jgi:hypothetical protein
MGAAKRKATLAQEWRLILDIVSQPDPAIGGVGNAAADEHVTVQVVDLKTSARAALSDKCDGIVRPPILAPQAAVRWSSTLRCCRQGRDGDQNSLHELTAGCALGTKAPPPPEQGTTQGALGVIASSFRATSSFWGQLFYEGLRLGLRAGPVDLGGTLIAVATVLEQRYIGTRGGIAHPIPSRDGLGQVVYGPELTITTRRLPKNLNRAIATQALAQFRKLYSARQGALGAP